MKKGFLLILLFLAHQVVAQNSSKLYINFTTHNEMFNENYDTDSTYFFQKVLHLEQLASMLISKNIKWNYQTCSKFVLGVLKYQNGATNSGDILQWMSDSPNITIDPRSKKQPPFYLYNIADVAHLLDSLGVPDSKTVGGFIYFPYSMEDWTQYEGSISGDVFGNVWQADILWGGGSIPPHTHDANNFGVWKPSGGNDSLAFYSHNPARHLWLVGNGCAYLVDNTTDIAVVFSAIKTYAEQIADGTLPSDRFYSLSVMFNQRDFSNNLTLKLGALADSINTLADAGLVQWATIQEKLNLFQQWSSTTGIPYSQWECGQQISTATGLPETAGQGLALFPNPTSEVLYLSWTGTVPLTSIRIFDTTGRMCWEGLEKQIPVQVLHPGLYILQVTDTKGGLRTSAFVKN